MTRVTVGVRRTDCSERASLPAGKPWECKSPDKRPSTRDLRQFSLDSTRVRPVLRHGIRAWCEKFFPGLWQCLHSVFGRLAGQQERGDTPPRIHVGGRMRRGAFDLFRRRPGDRVGSLKRVPSHRIVHQFADAEIGDLPYIVAPQDVLRFDVAVDDRVLSADVRVAKKSARRGGERPVTGDSGACGGTRGTTDRGGCGRGHRAGRLARRSATTRCLGGRAFGEQRGGITGPTVGCRRWPGGSGRGSGRAQRRGARRRHFSSRQGRSCLTHACRENPSRGVSGGIRVGRCGSVRRPSSKGWR